MRRCWAQSPVDRPHFSEIERSLFDLVSLYQEAEKPGRDAFNDAAQAQIRFVEQKEDPSPLHNHSHQAPNEDIELPVMGSFMTRNAPDPAVVQV